MLLRITFLLAVMTITLASCAAHRGILDQAQGAWDQGDYSQAASLYEEFIKNNKGNDTVSPVRFKLANIYFYNLKQYERAIQHYVAIVEDDPTSPNVDNAKERIAECYVALGKLKEAVSEYESLSRNHHNEIDLRRIRLNIADLYYDLNDLGQALAEYQKVVETSQYDDIAQRSWLRIAGIRFLRDEFGDALRAYQVLAEKTSDPDIRRQARFGIADCLERTFEYDLAVRILEQTEADSRNPDYIPKRIAAIRQHKKERNLGNPLESKVFN